MTMGAEDRIRALPLWNGGLTITPLTGGITNQNYLVTDSDRRAVVRLGGDIPLHGVMRFNECAASRAAAAAGISPAVRYAAPSVLVLDYIEGRTFAPDDIRARAEDCVDLIRRAHRDIAIYLRGPTLAFNVFHILRDYIASLGEAGSRLLPDLPQLETFSVALAQAAGPVDLVFGHNDLLAANFLDDGSRLWLIDWDYAGWNTCLFDLGGLASNNGFDAAGTEALRRRFHAIRCASLLREALWSAVSEHHSSIDFDYVSYTDDNLRRFLTAWTAFLEMRR